MKNKVQLIIFILSGIIIVVAIFQFSRFNPGGSNQFGISADLTMWGVEPVETFETIMRIYKDETGSDITYVEKDPRTFNADVTEALASGSGPDVVIANVDWIQDNRNKLLPADPTIVNVEAFEQVFVDLAPSTFIETITTRDNEVIQNIYGVPLWIDPLVLYWNKDLLNASSLALPPKDWTEFLNASNKLKSLGPSGQVIRAGSALGRANSIPLFKDIISLLLLQQAGGIEKSLLIRAGAIENTGESVLRFYTDFGKPGTLAYTWNNTLREPRELFIEGKVGMLIDYASFEPTLRTKSPHLSFAISPTPQIGPTEFPIYFADIGAAVIPRVSENQAAAWNFIRWLGGHDIVASVLENRAVVSARRDIVSDDNLTSPASRTIVLNAKRSKDTMPVFSSSLIKEMVESIADGRLTVSQAINNASLKFERTLQSR